MCPVGALGLGGAGVSVARAAGAVVGDTANATLVGGSVGAPGAVVGARVGAAGETNVGNASVGAGGVLVGVVEPHAVVSNTTNRTPNQVILERRSRDIFFLRKFVSRRDG